MRITAIVNSKGGTGKTTTAVNLATSAALGGHRVLLIDLDKQGSATQWLDHSPDNDDLMTALIEGGSLDPLVVPTSVEGLGLVPASITLAQTERLTAEPGHQFLLRDCLAKTTPRDWVFLDAPGDLGALTIMALATATDVLVPVPAGAMELDEVPKVRATIDKVRGRLNPDLQMAGVLLTQVRVYGRHTSVLAGRLARSCVRTSPAATCSMPSSGTTTASGRRRPGASRWRSSTPTAKAIRTTERCSTSC